MLQPGKTKYRKQQKGRVPNLASHQQEIQFGRYGMIALEEGYLKARQIEAARQTIRRKLERGGKLWIHAFPNYPVTRKPTELRMGKGKGSVSYWAFPVSAGRLLFEVEGVSKGAAFRAFRSGGNKLPLRVGIR